MFDENESQQIVKKPTIFGRLLRFIVNLVKFYLLGVGLIVTILSILLTIQIVRLFRGESPSHVTMTSAKSPDHIILKLKLDGSLYPGDPDLEQSVMSHIFGEKNALFMSTLRTALRRAALDSHIHGVAIEYSHLSAGKSSILELRQLLRSVHEAGKPVYAWASDLDSESYFLLSAADKLFLSSAGGLEITGPVFQLAYFGDALRKVGVDIEVLRAGKYKSAFEPFVANAPSAEVMEMYTTMEESLRAYYAEEIAAGRQKTPDVARQWLKRSIYNATDAKTDGLVDDLLFLDEMDELMANTLKPEKGNLETLTPRKYIQVSEHVESKLEHKGDESLALIEAEGEIVTVQGDYRRGEAIVPSQIRQEIEWAMDDDDIKAVVLRIDSPGGSASASDLIWRDLKRLATKKPLVISMADVAASGGYYMAVAGTKIIANPTSITGSIGVIGMLPNFAQFKEKYGVSFYVVTQSERAKMLNPGDKSSAYDKAMIENSIESTYQTFLQRVADGRKITVEQVHELAQGRVYTGRQALELKLVDDLGGLNEALRAAKELGNLDPNKLYPVERYEGEEHSLQECLSDLFNFTECVRDIDDSVMFRNFGKFFSTQKSSIFMAQPVEWMIQSLQSFRDQRDYVLTLASPYFLRF